MLLSRIALACRMPPLRCSDYWDWNLGFQFFDHRKVLSAQVNLTTIWFLSCPCQISIAVHMRKDFWIVWWWCYFFLFEKHGGYSIFPLLMSSTCNSMVVKHTHCCAMFSPHAWEKYFILAGFLFTLLEHPPCPFFFFLKGSVRTLCAGPSPNAGEKLAFDTCFFESAGVKPFASARENKGGAVHYYCVLCWDSLVLLSLNWSRLNSPVLSLLVVWLRQPCMWMMTLRGSSRLCCDVGYFTPNGWKEAG